MSLVKYIVYCILMLTLFVRSNVLFSTINKNDLMPNVIESKKANLIKTNVISSLKGDPILPSSITVDSQGFLYFFDKYRQAIVKLDDKMSFVDSFDMFEVNKNDSEVLGSMIHIAAGKNDSIYAYDMSRKTVFEFNESGKMTSKLPYFGEQMIAPVVDEKGYFYLPSERGGIVDVFNEKLEFIEKLLDEKDNNSFIYPDMSVQLTRRLRFPNRYNTFILINGDKISLLLNNNASYYSIKSKEVIHSKRIRPKKALENYFLKVKYGKEKMKQMKDNWYLPLFSNAFSDGDENGVFYLVIAGDLNKNQLNLYGFNEKGDLIKIYCIDSQSPFSFTFPQKKNERFYAIDNDTIAIYEEEK